MRKLNILIGESEDVLIELLTDIIDDIVKGKYELVIHTSNLSNEILRHSRNSNIDLFCLTLYNLIYTNSDTLPENRMENTLRFVSTVKDKFQKPIIAMASQPNDSDYAKRAISAGADYFLKLPFKISDFQDAFESILDEALLANENQK